MQAWSEDGHDVPRPGHWPSYVGGQPFPADLWGRAPLRGKAVAAIEEFVRARCEDGEAWEAGELVDLLIKVGAMVDELK